MSGEVWVGLAHVSGGSGTNLLDGRLGAYVNVLTLASDGNDFISKAREYLEGQGLYVREMEDVEPLRVRAKRETLSAEFLALANEADSSEKIILDTVFRYLEE